MITRKLFDSIFPTKGLNIRKYNLVRERELLIETLNEVLPRYGITTFMRICAFLGNCGIETDYFKTTIEYASGEDYEWRKSLGNVVAGDGRRFKGRGLTQTTGRFNYAAVTKTYGVRVGINFLIYPEKLAEVRHAVESACVFWDDHKLNLLADRGEFKQLSAIVNRGVKSLTPLHWSKRNELYSKCKRMIPRDFGFTPDPIVTATFQNGSVITTSGPAQTNSATSPATQTNQTATAGTDKPEDSFLTSAFDRNVSGDAVKTAVPSLGRRVWRFLVRPLLALEVLLEAGNVAAWLGVIVALILIGLFIYWHRADIKKLFQTLKNKFIE